MRRRLAACSALLALSLMCACAPAGQGPVGTPAAKPVTGLTLSEPVRMPVPTGAIDGGLSVVSGDGRFVVFVSTEATLVPGDTNEASDVFVFDIEKRSVERVSLDSEGSQRLGWWVDYPAISRDGRFVAWVWANGDPDAGTATKHDVYLRDRLKKTTVLISKGIAGGGANNFCVAPSISADGSRVAFDSMATNLVKGDKHPHDEYRAYLRLVPEGKTIRADVNWRGMPSNAESWGTLSADGTHMAIDGRAADFVPGQTGDSYGLFLSDLAAKTTVRIGGTGTGQAPNDGSGAPSLSSDGRRIAFESDATNLAPGDANGMTDVFVWDEATRLNSIVSAGPTSSPAPVEGADPEYDGVHDLAISGNGRFVVFSTNSAPVAGTRRYTGPQKPYDVYLRDTQTSRTYLVSDFGPIMSTLPITSSDASISDDGKTIVFTSNAGVDRGWGRYDWDLFVCRVSLAE